MELRRNGCWKIYLRYRTSFQKLEMNNLRLKFLENCRKADIIPMFLKFRVTKNGCFDDRNVMDSQKKLLKKEIVAARNDSKVLMEKITNFRKAIYRFCKKKDVDNELMTDINVKTLTYIKNCKKQKTPRNI